MTPHHALSAVDRLFRDLMGLDVPSGGKVFGVDWRQILPVAVHANRIAIVDICNGTLKNDCTLGEDIVEIPKECFVSADSIISAGHKKQNNFQLDFLNGITPSGMPLHVLNLKVGAVVMLLRNLNPMTATPGSDVVQSRRPIFDDFFQHLWPYTGNNTANVVFQMVKRLWLIRIETNDFT
ncbi:ATP-dependent DNA helicase [Trichonephila clavipes]|nr:ATP-dependent DNA helicase [Trichonephila clavipes]